MTCCNNSILKIKVLRRTKKKILKSSSLIVENEDFASFAIFLI